MSPGLNDRSRLLFIQVFIKDIDTVDQRKHIEVHEATPLFSGDLAVRM
ncbi:MAG: hypothetical protein ABI910_09805 [Gemmatimonadota bacterium]